MTDPDFVVMTITTRGRQITVTTRVLENTFVSAAPDFPSPIKTKRGLLLSPLAYRSSAIRQARARFRKEVSNRN